MGVKDLLPWVKKTYPQVVTKYPERWASPALRGKRVAIDATLMTNRFHFAENDVSARGTRTVLGWYSMIREMQLHGVQPIAVWDERGDRPWKAPEARKRLETRARYLARAQHEDRRRTRITDLKDEMRRFGLLSAREQAVVSAGCEGRLPSFPNDLAVEAAAEWLLESSEEKPQPKRMEPQPLTLSPRFVATAFTVSNLVSRVATLSSLFEEYQDESRPTIRPNQRGEQPSVEAFEEEEEDLRRIAREAELEAKGKEGADEVGDAEGDEEMAKQHANAEAVVAAAELLQDDKGAAVIDARLRCLPLEEYTETPKQRRLSAQEGAAWNTVFGPESERGVEGWRQAMAIIRDLEQRMPVIRSIYTRALAIPEEDHHQACRELLELMGVPIVFANVPYEAEGLCSAMALSGVVDFAGTEDSDVVVYGGPLLRNLSLAKEPLVLVDGGTLADHVPLTNEAWRDFCILLGTDASPRIPRVGPATAFKLIQKHGSIESILAENPELADRVPVDFMEMIANSRRLFTDLPPLPTIPEVTERPDHEILAWIRDLGAEVPDHWSYGSRREAAMAGGGRGEGPYEWVGPWQEYVRSRRGDFGEEMGDRFVGWEGGEVGVEVQSEASRTFVNTYTQTSAATSYPEVFWEVDEASEAIEGHAEEGEGREGREGRQERGRVASLPPWDDIAGRQPRLGPWGPTLVPELPAWDEVR